MCPLGYPEGKYGSGEDPRRERHQTEEPVREFLADERSGGCGGLKGPDCRHDETGGLNGELGDPFLLVFASALADGICRSRSRNPWPGW